MHVVCQLLLLNTSTHSDDKNDKTNYKVKRKIEVIFIEKFIKVIYPVKKSIQIVIFQ